MLRKCKAIVIGTINYSENSVVLKCYTDLFGLQSYMVNGINSKKAAIKPSQLMPLTLLEIEVYHQSNKNLHRIKELKCVPLLNQIHFDLLKSSVGMFVAELIGKCMREENNPDEKLFEFIFNSIQILDIQEDSLANFPVYFMLHLSKYLGFFPKLNFSDKSNSFSLHEGMFVNEYIPNPDYVKADLSEYIYLLATSDFKASTSIAIPYQSRIKLLEMMIRYYQIHLMVFGELKSPKVLNEIMN